MDTVVYHTPVMLAESIAAMQIAPAGVYVDVTLGGGGYAAAILSELGEKGRLLCFDQDDDALCHAPKDSRCTVVRSNFRYLLNFLRYHNVTEVDAIVADLGVSGHHFDDPSRGFTFRGNAPLDMRMNRNAPLTAAQVINDYSEEQLSNILHIYGELPQWRRMAQCIVKARCQQPILTNEQLLQAVASFIPPRHEKRVLAQLFQALRMEVNHEMDALQELLLGATETLRPGGRLVVITYHSLEDRMVKNIMRCGNVQGEVVKDFYGAVASPYEPHTKSFTPTAEEIARNPRARSARLRVAVKCIPNTSVPKRG